MKKLLFILPLVLLIACVQVPTTTILVPTAHGVVTIKAPKDSKIVGLKADFVKGTVSLDTYEAKMNPDVIGASALGQVELIKANTELANALGQMGMTAFARSQGIPLSSASSPSTAPQANPTITTDQLNALIQRRAEEVAAAHNPAPALGSAATNAPARPRARTARTNAPPATVSTNTPPGT